MERDEQAWRAAERSHLEGTDGRAFRHWSALDVSLPKGKEAHDRLRRADEHYRRAIALFRDGKPGVREAVQAGIALGPMDPAHYLSFARLCAEQGLTTRASDFYRKYLAQEPPPPDGEQVRVEWAALDGGEDPFPPAFFAVPGRTSNTLTIVLTGIGGLLMVVAGYWLRRRRARRLSALLPGRPEWHPTVAYHLGCLRHEFLKHRVGPLGDPLRALADGRATFEQSRFLRDRGVAHADLSRAFRAHLEPMERALGLEFRLDQADPIFVGARRAVQVLDGISWPLRPRRLGTLVRAHARLMAFDARLAAIIAHLVHCRVDESFLRDVLASTRAEYGLAHIALHDVRVGPVSADAEVDVFRTDLYIVLRNLLRNAIAAMSDQTGERRLALEVFLELEATGEDVVVLRVLDNCPKPIDSLGVTATDRGLGLVAQVLRRYDGSMRVESGDDGYAKAVAVRFFHSQRHGGTWGEGA